MWYIDIDVILTILTIALTIATIVVHVITLDTNNLDVFDRDSYLSSVPTGGSRNCFGIIYDRGGDNIMLWNTLTDLNFVFG